jgi:hypothetical protein
VARRFRVSGWGITRRTAQVLLGALWLVDAVLQYEPKMFGQGFVTQFILPNAQGQPEPLRWSITSVGHLVSHGTPTWNAAVGTLQIAIGVGLLVRSLVRPALTVMFVWCLLVWWFGEGFGGLLTGTATPLTGAPGSVALYAVIGILAWPARDREVQQTTAPGGGATTEPGHESSVSGYADDGIEDPRREFGPTGVASSGLAQGPLGVDGALVAWSGFWLLSAVLWVLPANRTPDAASSAISSMASGQPGWFAHFLTNVGSALTGQGTTVAWLLALASVIIAFGPLFARRPVPFVMAGGVLQLAYWITGMAFGLILTGMTTDLNTALPVLVLAVGLIPKVPAPRDAEIPFLALYRHHRTIASVGLVAGGTAVVIGFCYPLVASASPPSPPVQALPTPTTSPPTTQPLILSAEGGPAVVQFQAPTNFSCLAQNPAQAQITIGWNVPSSTEVTVRFDGSVMHRGIRQQLPFDVPAGPSVGPGATLVFGCNSGSTHTVVLTWRREGIRETTRVVRVDKVPAP